MNTVYDAIIIGGGPAGLLAGAVLRQSGNNYLIIEQGNSIEVRNANNPIDVASGVGGAGLFSDGKLSFPPSATELWTQLDFKKIENSYTELCKHFSALEIEIPSFENILFYVDEYDKKNEINIKKDYFSVSLNEYQRNSILFYLYSKNKKFLKPNLKIDKIVLDNEISSYENLYKLYSSTGECFSTQHIIVATGKYGIKSIEDIEFLEKKELIEKIEIGVRVNVPNEFFIPYYDRQIDYKIIDKINNHAEFRTFCCCKNGEIIQSKFKSYNSFNGTKFQLETKMSNIGLLIRSDSKKDVFYNELENKIKEDRFNLNVLDFIESENILIGQHSDIVIKENIKKIIKYEGYANSYILGPEVEYVGEYLKSDNDLKVHKNIWLAGDVTGRFRGLLPAMLSGIFCALAITSKVNTSFKKSIEKMKINIIPHKSMDLIFTAQSKKFFYCREVICEYVLKQGKLPINPFMVFDYFLHDRVDRNLVRNGNNQLVTDCKELWVFGPIADGVLFEIALAKKLHKKIRFFKIGTTVDDICEIHNISEISFEPEVHSKQIKRDDLISFINNHFKTSSKDNLPKEQTLGSQISLFVRK